MINYARVGAIELYTTANDLTRWVQNFDNRIVDADGTIDLMHERGRLNSDDTLDYAFGLSIGDYKGTRCISHSGSHRSFRTHMMRLPDEDLAIIVLGNLEEFNPTSMAQQVADLFLARDLSEYAGAFYTEAFQLDLDKTCQNPGGESACIDWKRTCFAEASLPLMSKSFDRYHIAQLPCRIILVAARCIWSSNFTAQRMLFQREPVSSDTCLVCIARYHLRGG